MGTFSVSGAQVSRMRLSGAYHDYLSRVLRAFEAGDDITLVEDASPERPARRIARSEVEIRSFFAAVRG